MADVRETRQTPMPEWVAAWLALHDLPTEEVPMWAAWWLVEGFDGPHLRLLAGLPGDDPFEVRAVLPDALAEMGVEVPDAFAATRVVFEGLAARCLSGRLSEREVAQAVWRVYVDRDYASEVWDEPLGVVGAMDDEWDAGWGRGDRQLRQAVRKACEAQLRRGDD